ncbi:MAG: coniferyl aldehyde dehydrogenase [Proteobacteria bacterium]|nr:coniferyl aldehyde dehydrogenase [Pseudomonadota bacterium]
MEPFAAPPDTPVESLLPTLRKLRAAQAARIPDYAQRRDDLDRLRRAFQGRVEEMAKVVSADFGNRSRHESLVADGMTVLGEIDFIRSHLKSWMRPRARRVNWLFVPARAQVLMQPLGVVGVIAPWNYPVSLALKPLAAVIAAGNHVMVKPSEHTPRTSAFLRELLDEVFPAERVAVALGGAAVAGAFAALPFDHLFFTGSTAVGRKVMAAAAQNLTPVTLELGGKSPCVIGEGYPLPLAAARIAAGKWLNAGQTCIAPDYLLVPHAARDDFITALGSEMRARFPTIAGNPDYTSIVNDGQYRRLRGYLDEASAHGVRTLELVPCPREQADAQRLLPPTLLIDPPEDLAVMREEIFGPILPIKSYRTLDEAIAYINAHPRPLALYHFDNDRARVQQMLERTVAGGVSINDTVMHYAQERLPFGGVGPSGMGRYHGYDGFATFSHPKAVLRQARLSSMALFKPPYRGLADRLVKFLTR